MVVPPTTVVVVTEVDVIVRVVWLAAGVIVRVGVVVIC